MSLLAPPDEEAAIRSRYWRTGPGEVVVDVGSFEGAYTIPALTAGATVYAIDARASTLKQLRKIVRADTIADERLTTIHAALYNGREYPAGLITAIHECKYASGQDMAPDLNVKWSTLDEVMSALKPVRLDHLKIDVEGGELGVLKGAKQTLCQWRPSLLIEDHTRIYPWVAERQMTAKIMRLLAKLGYGLELVSDTYADYIIGVA